MSSLTGKSCVCHRRFARDRIGVSEGTGCGRRLGRDHGNGSGRLDSAVTTLGSNVLGIRADVRKYADVEGALAQTVSKFGGLDILINNAGVGVFRSVSEMAR